MSYSGRYKGVTFRSLLELSVIKHFESEGMVFGDDFLYEETKVPYGRSGRNYIVDLTFPKNKLLVEVKPSSRAENKNNTAKRRGAEEWCDTNGWEYLIITEEELRQCGEILTLDKVSTMADVELNERAKRAVRKRQAKAARKKRK